ncbi:ATP-binding protein [Mastigocoleus testarum]|uniref:Orc1-like AAA ATPase domain-containing protein n=1 Tax=Mastigocoleus testarum BC008 TaxID=371196 RepID=A0A0V7ZMK3_9CYAN|nr:ATP-binding protein [Mastigocoleus testarum]KST65925.1 hypothetical protein BC008_23420 [Mastigocoleus testarum BC008]
MNSQPLPITTNNRIIPAEFQQTLQEKSLNFVGREFIFTAIDNFLNRYDRGYFTIVGAPGSGKSAILAKYVRENSHVFYYNAQVAGKNRAEEFLKTISTQVEAASGTSLQLILQHISDQLAPKQRFVIAIDSLDAIDYNSQSIGSNLFYLPRYLPKGIYFLLAHRPFVRETSGLLIEAPFRFLNLKDYPEENRQDIQAYIQKSIQQYIQKGLHLSAANKQKFGANKREFIQQLTNKSGNNFMYVNQILTALETDLYPANSSLTEILDGTYFPPALETYYQQHLQKMFPAEEADPIAQAVLNTLVQNSLAQNQSPLLQPRGQTVEEISQIIDADEYDVEEVLENWIEFLTVHQVDENNKYGLYHGNFGKWLSAHPQSKYL